MQFQELTYLLSPIILIITALFVLIIDFFTNRKSVLMIYTLFGIFISALILVIQFINFDSNKNIFFDTLVFDKLYIFMALFLIILTFVILLAFYDYIINQITFRSEFISLLLLSLVGSLLVIMSIDFITLYLSLELASLPIISLVAFGRGKFSLEAAFKYLILASLSTGIFLMGVAYIYGITGSIDIVNINISYINPALILGLVFLFMGIAFKLSIAPWHMWTPDTYQGSPMPIVTYLSTVSKVAGFVLIMRIFLEIFTINFDSHNFIIFLSLVSFLSMTIGNFGAIFQKDLKRLFAYSTVAHAGYMLVGVIALISTSSAGSTTLFYVIGYAITNLTVFFCLQHVINLTQSSSIDSLKGLFHSYPLVSIMLTVSILSLLGIPATVGFMGKVLVFSSAVDNGLAWLAIVGVINSFISAYYYLGILRNIFMSSEKFEQKSNSNNNYILVASLSSLIVLVLGIFPDVLLSVIDDVMSAI
ncbi:MAG: NADH-quinone oxidoreductase subunit N [SAR202 cluster bacterium]|nr:NADH-quinone oxidoreductase subunit N [SAR202 cluster bacterium]|tara:strand:- start:61 stop:1488 length:1428 start_codon:yes stop_codon:yes gene_type:complete